ncbi:MAG TPA: carboxymuconolactone decarboxylase family protein [Polyangiaceae bacterium]|jgi:alkylhydroperoxidase family enzyme|nr:carboxymuconolactone decarboxylase family protein [Polyangiaceae bacterium]
MTNARLEAIPPPYSSQVTEQLARLMPAGVPPLALFRTLAVNDRVLSRMLSSGLLDRGAVSLRERELVILRTCARLESEYEWGVHVTMFSEKAGLTHGEVAATRSDSGATFQCFPAREVRLLRLVDELIDTATVSDGLWREVAALWSAPALVEIVALVGFYHSVAFATNAFKIPLESFAARFPGA